MIAHSKTVWEGSHGDNACFTVNGHAVNAVYKGVFAIKLTDNGKIEKAACGDCALLEVSGEKIAVPDKPQDILIFEK